MTGITATTAIVILHILGDGLHLTLLAVGAAEFQSTHLECAQSIAQFDDMYQAIEIVRGEY